MNCRPLHYQWSALPLSYRSNRAAERMACERRGRLCHRLRRLARARRQDAAGRQKRAGNRLATHQRRCSDADETLKGALFHIPYSLLAPAAPHERSRPKNSPPRTREPRGGARRTRAAAGRGLAREFETAQIPPARASRHRGGTNRAERRAPCRFGRLAFASTFT